MFKIGEEVVCKLDGVEGYIVNSFRACLVKFKTEIRVIPEEYLVQEEVITYQKMKQAAFQKGDHVIFVEPTEHIKELRGEVVLSKRFYIVHLFKSGELKVVFDDILAKKGTKILSKVILAPTPGQKFGRDIPGQGKIFSDN